MKKLLFLLIFLPGIMVGQRSAQWWFDAGLKVQYGATGLYNKAIVDNSEWNYEIGTGSSFGGKLGLNYATHGFTLDVMFGSSAQPFDQSGATTLNEVKWKHTDLYVLYRNNKSLGFFEIGPKLSLINSVENDNGSMVTDISNQFEGNSLAGVLGFGVYLLGSDGAFSGILGFRLEYGITDMVSDAGAAANAPLAETSFAYPQDGYTGSHPIFAGISFELNWGIGYFGKASCGGRSKFMKF